MISGAAPTDLSGKRCFITGANGDACEAVPLGYMGKPAEVARVTAFLAYEQSQYITAQILSVDGGNVLR
ncbi:MAG: SDR family oxidoreductase [Hyphomicrobiales bacterium]